MQEMSSIKPWRKQGKNMLRTSTHYRILSPELVKNKNKKLSCLRFFLELFVPNC